MPKITSGEPTEKQLDVLELLEAGTDINAVRIKLDISRTAVDKRLDSAKNVVDSKNGDGAFARLYPLSNTYLLEPAYTKHIADDKLVVEAKALSIPPGKLRILKNRINFVRKNIEGQPVLQTDRQLQDAVREKLSMVLGYMDNFSLGTAKLSELSSVFKSLFEAKQLLDGKPTQILDNTARLELDKLLPMLAAEAKRRGVIMKDIEGEVIPQTVPAPKKRKLRDPPNAGGAFPYGASKAYFDRNGFRWPGDPMDEPRTKWKDIDENGY